MKSYLVMIIFIFMCCVLQYTLVEIVLELKRNILNFGYRINFNYEGMLAHSFERFYVITKFILPSANDLPFSPLDFNTKYNYLNEDLSEHHNAKQHVCNLKIYCMKIVPFVDFYKKKTNFFL